MKSAAPLAATLAVSLALAPTFAHGAGRAGAFPGEAEFNACKKLPGDKAVVKLNLKAETEVSDLIRWMSTLTCTPFLVPGTVPLRGRRITILAPERMTVSEAYHLFYAALDSVNLDVEPSGKFLRITSKPR